MEEAGAGQRCWTTRRSSGLGAEHELREVVKRCGALEQSLTEKESELAKAHQAACDAQGETQGALQEIQEARKIAAGKACST